MTKVCINIQDINLQGVSKLYYVRNVKAGRGDLNKQIS